MIMNRSLPLAIDFRQRGIRRFEREILPAGEKSNEGAPFLCGLIADRPSQNGVARLEASGWNAA